MTIAPGSRLGAYEVLSALGAGGMGEVYRARDTKLNRDVALKILPDAFALDADRLARFSREAQVLASLNHPHIAQIHGYEQAGAVHALVMELVEGPTLADRIARGALPIDDALSIGRQVAVALEAAHEQGIIHRDLKPANIKVREDGTVKVLDFGLAKVLDRSETSDVRDGRGVSGPAGVTASPTLTSPALMTGVGMILGTAAYMSPEQAKGRIADKRSDVWAFGCVLFEMLTGARAFDGEDVADTLAAVLMRDPNWTAIPKELPPPVRGLLEKCLIRDRHKRVGDLSVVRFVLDTPMSLATSGSAATVEVKRQRTWQRALPWAIATLAVASLAASLLIWSPWRRVPVPEPVRLTADVGADVGLLVSGPPGGNIALSPDGKLLVFAAQKASGSQLYIRRFDQLQATPLAGTDEGRYPFFKPDGQWIGFFAQNKLKKIAVTGGAAVTLCDVPNGRGGTWSDDGTIVFSPSGSVGVTLMRVGETGGNAQALLKIADGEVSQRWPQILPGGKEVLFTSASNPANYDEASVVVVRLADQKRVVIQRGGFFGRYLASGHVVYIHGATLFAVPFDRERLIVTGQPVPVLEGVTSSAGTGGAQFAAATNGTVVYLAGGASGTDAPIVWMDRDGKTTPLRTTASDWSNPRFSPDGTRLAIDVSGGGGQPGVWVYDWARDALSRITFGSALDVKPAWTPDGGRITFTSTRSNTGLGNLYWQRADGTGDAQRLTESMNNQVGGSWHPNGKVFAFYETRPSTGNDLMMLTIEGSEEAGWKPAKPSVFLSTPYNEQAPVFSPDGRWLAYVSNETGTPEIYVRPYPESSGKWQVSTGGGIYPVWSRARREILFATTDQHMMAASYSVSGDSFQADKPRLWTPTQYMGRPRLQSYDLHPDGNRLAVAPLPATAEGRQDKLIFVFNFHDELRRLAPVAH